MFLFFFKKTNKKKKKLISSCFDCSSATYEQENLQRLRQFAVLARAEYDPGDNPGPARVHVFRAELVAAANASWELAGNASGSVQLTVEDDQGLVLVETSGSKYVTKTANVLAGRRYSVQSLATNSPQFHVLLLNGQVLDATESHVSTCDDPPPDPRHSHFLFIFFVMSFFLSRCPRCKTAAR